MRGILAGREEQDRQLPFKGSQKSDDSFSKLCLSDKNDCVMDVLQLYLLVRPFVVQRS